MTPTWGITQDERQFIFALAYNGKGRALQNYARIVMGDFRTWDPGVDVASVKSAVQVALNMLAEGDTQ